MARSGALLLLLVLVLSASFLTNADVISRKLLTSSKAEDTKGNSSSNFRSWLRTLFLGALSNDKVASSSPSNNDHATTLANEKLFQGHLARIDRILQSVPSPGVGH